MIKVKNNWVIDADGNQYLLKQETGKLNKAGDMTYRDVTYHSSVESALYTLINKCQMELVEHNDLTLKQAVNEFRLINEELHNLLEGKFN